MSNNDPQVMDDTEGDDSVIGRALLRSLAVFLGLGLMVGGAYLFLRPVKKIVNLPKSDVLLPVVRDSVEKPSIAMWTDITTSAGIDFIHVNGATGEKLLPETMGGGCAFLDYDNDGDQDLLLVNGRQWTGQSPTDQTPATLAFYENNGKGSFTNVTKQVGLDISVYGMGVACGDYDNDGRVDLFISCLGQNHLFHNEGKRFVDVTHPSGVGGDDKAWSTSCGWFDYDRDGDLDLMVCKYVQWTRQNDISQNFRLLGRQDRAYGRPQNFGGTFPSLYRNDGQGKFTDVSEAAGLQIKNSATGVPVAKSLGVVFEDFDADGYLDCVIANDTVQNFLFRNRKDGTFEEIGVQSGIGYDTAGAARGAMGIDVAAFRNDRSIGIAIGNFANEMTALYVAGKHDLQFNDVAVANGLGPATRLELKFAVLFLDYDLDGRLDLFQANGHLEEDIAKVQASQRYEQSPQLFWNAGPERKNTEFVQCTVEETGASFPVPMVGRGAAYADIDHDGDLDLVIVGCGQKPRLLRNDQELANHWLRVKLIGKTVNRDAIGAHVELRSGNAVQTRLVSPTRSYLSQVELPVTFGLGSKDSIDSLTIRWPNGQVQEIKHPAIDKMLSIEQ